MIRIVIAASRNPALSRMEFFDHLRNVHWPLVRGAGTVLPYLKHYTQNHVIQPVDGLEMQTPFPLFARDSVIELGFDSIDSLAEMSALPEYRDVIRPDEARFNDLPNIIATPCAIEPVFHGGSQGRVTRFDFLNRAPGSSLCEFKAWLAETGRTLSLDPLYRSFVEQRIHYLALNREERGTARQDGWSADQGFDAIVATRACDMTLLRQAEIYFPGRAIGHVDAATSRSLVAANFLMHEA